MKVYTSVFCGIFASEQAMRDAGFRVDPHRLHELEVQGTEEDSAKVKKLVENYLHSCQLYGSEPSADDIVGMVECLAGKGTEEILEKLEAEVEEAREVRGSVEGDLREWLLCAEERYPGAEVAPMVLSRAKRMADALGQGTKPECTECGEASGDLVCTRCLDSHIHHALDSARNAVEAVGVDPDSVGLEDRYRVPDLHNTQEVLAGVRGVIESLGEAMAFSSRDWSTEHRDAWLYGIVCGWEKDYGDGDGPSGAMAEVAKQHGWTPETVECLREYRRAIEALMTTGKDGA